jgi:hypothetical protein
MPCGGVVGVGVDDDVATHRQRENGKEMIYIINIIQSHRGAFAHRQAMVVV